jgi:hypothetical protein
MKINRTILFYLVLAVILYITGLTLYSWLGYSPTPKVTPWDNFYFYNEYYLKVVIPLFAGLLITIREIKILFLGLTALQFLLLVYEFLKLLDIVPGIIYYKIVSLVGSVMLLIYIGYVSSRRFYKT